MNEGNDKRLAGQPGGLVSWRWTDASTEYVAAAGYMVSGGKACEWQSKWSVLKGFKCSDIVCDC